MLKQIPLEFTQLLTEFHLLMLVFILFEKYHESIQHNKNHTQIYVNREAYNERLSNP